MTVTGRVNDTNGNPLQRFSLQVTNPDNETVLNQEFINGQFIVDAVPGYEYWFSAMPNYGGVRVMGEDLYNGYTVIVPITFDAPQISKTGQTIYFALAGVLILLLLKRKK